MLRNQRRAWLGSIGCAGALAAALCAIPSTSHAQATAASKGEHAPVAPAPAAGAGSPSLSENVPPSANGEAPGSAPSSTDGASAPVATPEAGAPTDAPATDDSADDVAEAPAPTASATDARRVTELKAQLQHESAQRVNNLWPWLTLGVGAGAVLVGTIGGAGYVLACDGECGTTPWVSVLVVAGAGVATLGTIWLLRINADNAQVESRTRRLERELERLDHASGPRTRSQARAAPIVSLHF